MVEELRKIAGANMLDYMKSTPEGLSVVDFSGLTRDQTAALSQVTAAVLRVSPYAYQPDVPLLLAP